MLELIYINIQNNKATLDSFLKTISVIEKKELDEGQIERATQLFNGVKNKEVDYAFFKSHIENKIQ